MRRNPMAMNLQGVLAFEPKWQSIGLPRNEAHLLFLVPRILVVSSFPEVGLQPIDLETVETGILVPDTFQRRGKRKDDVSNLVGLPMDVEFWV